MTGSGLFHPTTTRAAAFVVRVEYGAGDATYRRSRPVRTLIVAVETLFPEPKRARPLVRSASFLAPAVALGCALTPLLVVVGAYAQTV